MMVMMTDDDNNDNGKKEDNVDDGGGGNDDNGDDGGDDSGDSVITVGVVVISYMCKCSSIKRNKMPMVTQLVNYTDLQTKLLSGSEISKVI